MMYVKSFKNITRDDFLQIGGKGASLAQMLSEGFPVPDGFVVTANAFDEFLHKPISETFKTEVLQAFHDLRCERLAVRSSTVAEDSKTASWAGQFETFLNVTEENLIEGIKNCWEATESERTKAYSEKQGVEYQKVAVVVQKMVASKISGVLFTVNPVTKNKDEIMLEAIYGLGELLVQGEVTPFSYIIDKNTLEIKSSTKGDQDVQLIYKDGKTQSAHLLEVEKQSEILELESLKKIARLGLQIEEMYKLPQDIEWAQENNVFYIVQARPVTAL